jgi:MFS family permease
MSHPTERPLRFSSDYIITWTATFLFFVGFYALLVPLPRYLSAVALPDWQVGLVLGASGITSLVVRPFSGLLIDRFGYQRIFISGALALLVGAVGVIFTANVALLFALRILQAIGYVVFTTTGTAFVGHTASQQDRSRQIAYFGLAANFAITLTPGATDLLLPYTGLIPLFLLSGFFAIAAGILTRFLSAVPTNPANASSAQLAQWRLPGQLWLAIFVAALFGVGFGAYFQYFAILLERREIAAAPVYATYGITIIATRLIFGGYLDRIGVARVLVVGALLMGIGLALAAFGTSTLLLVVAAALIASGGGFFHPMLIAHHVTLLPERPGWAVACFYSGFDAGIGLGAWLLGFILDFSGLTALYLAASLVTLFTLLFIPWLVRRPAVANAPA